MEFLEVNKMSSSLIDPESPFILCLKGKGLRGLC